jgi:hypothetical protein
MILEPELGRTGQQRVSQARNHFDIGRQAAAVCVMSRLKPVVNSVVGHHQPGRLAGLLRASRSARSFTFRLSIRLIELRNAAGMWAGAGWRA